MKIKAIELDVFIDGKNCSGGSKLKSVIKSQSEFTLPLRVQLSIKNRLVGCIAWIVLRKKYLLNYKDIYQTINQLPIKNSLLIIPKR